MLIDAKSIISYNGLREMDFPKPCCSYEGVQSYVKISFAKYFPEPQISVSNKCLKFDLLGRKARSEQCWSSQDKTVRNNSSVEEVDTDALYDSNNGRIIMLNCGTC